MTDKPTFTTTTTAGTTQNQAATLYMALGVLDNSFIFETTITPKIRKFLSLP